MPGWRLFRREPVLARVCDHAGVPLTSDELLSTTRSVRKRLDLTRPVPLDLVQECLEIALQAPNGGMREGWHWIVVTDPQARAQVVSYRGLAALFRVQIYQFGALLSRRRTGQGFRGRSGPGARLGWARG